MVVMLQVLVLGLVNLVVVLVVSTVEVHLEVLLVER